MIKNLIYSEAERISKKLFLRFKLISKPKRLIRHIITWLVFKKYLIKRTLLYLSRVQISFAIIHWFKNYNKFLISMLKIKNPFRISEFNLLKKLIGSWAIRSLKYIFQWMVRPGFIREVRAVLGILLAGLLLIKKLATRVFFNLTKTPDDKDLSILSQKPLHWLISPKIIHKLWISGIALLSGLLLIEAFLGLYGYFDVDSAFGFNAWFGFLVCVGMVVLAKGLGAFLKREESFYEHD